MKQIRVKLSPEAEEVYRYINAQAPVTNLFRVELPNFWRMLYTLTAEGDVEIIAFILDIIDHKTYDKKFGYRKK